MSRLLIFLFIEVVENVASANDLNVRHHAALLDIWSRHHSNLVYFLHYGSVWDRFFKMDATLTFQEVLVVVYIADLRRYCDTFLVSSADLTVIQKCFIGRLALARIDQVAAYHDPRSALASFAMNADYVFYIFAEESIHIFAKVVDIDKRGRLMIIELVLMRDPIKVVMIIGSFCAQVVYFVSSRMLVSKELFDVFHMIAVNALYAYRRESHCDDPFRDVAKIEIITSFLIAILLE